MDNNSNNLGNLNNKVNSQPAVDSGVNSAAPQANAQSGSPTKTKAEIMAIKDAQQRQMEIAKNINLFTK